MPENELRVAIIHYWILSNRGGEKVLSELCKMYPQADVYTHVYNPAVQIEHLRPEQVSTTFINRLPGAKKYYKRYLPLMPLALEQLDLTNYDLIISSESGPAKGGIRHPDALHVCYTHSPMRYIWDQYRLYKEKFGFGTKLLAGLFFHYLRLWDFASASRVDLFIANSRFVGRRIGMTYGRRAEVVNPPVDLEAFSPSSEIDDYYLWVGQLVPYKRPELAIEACISLGRKLVIVGHGELEKTIKQRYGDAVEIHGRLPFDELKRRYARCKALLYTGEEDFGITPVEVMASGRPVVALGRGGAAETVTDGVTGIFFDKATPEALIGAMERFEDWLPSFKPADAVESSKRFSRENFVLSMRRVIDEALRRREADIAIPRDVERSNVVSYPGAAKAGGA